MLHVTSLSNLDKRVVPQGTLHASSTRLPFPGWRAGFFFKQSHTLWRWVLWAEGFWGGGSANAAQHTIFLGPKWQGRTDWAGWVRNPKTTSTPPPGSCPEQKAPPWVGKRGLRGGPLPPGSAVMFVFGGHDAGRQFCATLHALALPHRHWLAFAPGGLPPSPRGWHAMAALDGCGRPCGLHAS